MFVKNQFKSIWNVEFAQEAQTEQKSDFADFVDEDIQNLDIQNKGYCISLRDVFIPWNGSQKTPYHYVIRNVLPGQYDAFLHLENSRLQGNEIVGDLSYFQNGEDKVYIWYQEDTFDKAYQKKHPEFFLDEQAPQTLKDKFYQKIADFDEEDYSHVLDAYQEMDELNHSSAADFDEYGNVKGYYRQVLTFEEYMQNYEWLKGKYLDGFQISKEEKGKIRLVEGLGLALAEQVVKQLIASPIPLEMSFGMIAEMDDEQFSQLPIPRNVSEGVLVVDQLSRGLHKEKQKTKEN